MLETRASASSRAIRLPSSLLDEASRRADAEFRTLPKHIEFYYMLARAARDNPDLPISFIEDVLLAKDEPASPFKFRTTEQKDHADNPKK